MNILYSKKDYVNNYISVIFDGEFVEHTLLEYLDQHYPINGPGIYQRSEVVKTTETTSMINVEVVEFFFTTEVKKA